MTRAHGVAGGHIARTLGPKLHRHSRFHAIALGMSHAELVRRAVDNFIRHPDPVQSAMNRQTAALDRVVDTYEHGALDDNMSPEVARIIGEDDGL